MKAFENIVKLKIIGDLIYLKEYYTALVGLP